MMTALQCAQLCGELYTNPVPAAWNHLWSGGEVVCALRKLEDRDALIFRGSVTVTDWLRDLQALPAWDPELGFVHGGFLAEMDVALAEAVPNLKQPVVVTGHSLGGARARIAAAKLAVRGIQVAQLVVFGSPRPGFANVRRIIEKSGIQHESWRNRNDPVPLVPFPVPALLPFEHTEPWGAFDEKADGDDLQPTRDHDIHLYLAGAAKLLPER